MTGPAGAFAFLITRTIRNRIARQLARRDEPAEMERMTAAIRERFAPETPFGAHQFIGPAPASWKRQFGKKSLQVTLAENTLKDPMAVWFEKVLGVSPWETGGTALDSLQLRRGSLLHDAVRVVMKAGWRPSPGMLPELGRPEGHADEIRRRAIDAWVGKLRAGVDSWFGRIPVWWEIELSELRSSAQRVIDYFSAEETPETLYAVEMALSLPFGGIHWAAKLDHISRNGKNWTITDLKTGAGAAAKELKPAGLARDGEGFQLVVYAMILAEQLKLDGSRVALRYHHPRLRGGGETTREALDMLAPFALPLVTYLEQAWGAGRFGQRSDEKAVRPLAHLAIPDDILRDKWNRTEGLNRWSWEISVRKKGGDDEDESQE